MAFSIKYSLPIADIIITKLETSPGGQYLLDTASVKLVWTLHIEKRTAKTSIHYWLSQLQPQKLTFWAFNPLSSLPSKQPTLFLKQSHLSLPPSSNSLFFADHVENTFFITF